MGCLTVNIQSLSSNIDVDINKADDSCVCISLQDLVDVDVERKDGACVCVNKTNRDIGVNIGLLCSVGQGAWEYLMCSDLGYIRTYDKGFILVRK